MNILLSAYACEPNKGSEPGVGWGWALEWAKNHNVWVITRDNNKAVIDEYLKLHCEIDSTRLHFVYVGLSRKLTFWKKGRRGIRLYYMLWQNKAYKVAKSISKDNKLDFVQHITFVSYTQPSYMYRLKIPFIWGPVSGAENIPKRIKLKCSFNEGVAELVRKISQDIALIMPATTNCLKNAKIILVTTEETKNKFPERYQKKIKVMPAIGLEKILPIIPKKEESKKIRIIMAGRLIYWKAFDIGMEAYMKIANDYPDTELHILGEGNKKSELIEKAGEFLNKQIFFETPIKHDQIIQFYESFDIFLNTTLRDSGCMTMMEAMSAGLPCIAIACGGPGFLIKEFGGIAVEPNVNNIVDELSIGLKKLITDSKLRNEISSYSSSKLHGITYNTKCSEIETLFNC